MPQLLDRRDIFRASAAAAGVAVVGLGLSDKRQVRAAYDSEWPIRLVANENPYGPSASAQDAMVDAVGDGWMYATSEVQFLRRLIAEREGVSPNNILITAGSGELLKMAGLGFGLDGGVIAARPTFPMLVDYVRSTGGVVQEVNLDGDMVHDLATMESYISDKTSLVYVCNPNNPTGTILDASTLRSFIGSVEGRVTVFIDEAYIDLLDEPRENAMVDQVIAGKNVIIARTFSKLHGMAGLRVGYAIAREDLIRRLRPLQMSFLNVMGLRAAIASYQDVVFQEFSKSRIQACVNFTQSSLESIGLPYTPSKTNFVLFDTGGSVYKFASFMRDKRIIVGQSYAPYDTWCRVSMGTVEQMAIFSEFLEEYYRG